MMMECPRCGFAQPKDQYCASCGANVDLLLAKPKPFFVRLMANPNFHLSLIGGLIVLVVGWIFYTQSATVSREVRRVLDRPVFSQNAGEPGDPEAEHAAASKVVAEDTANDVSEPEPVAQPPTAAASGAVAVGESRTPEEILAAAVGAPPPPGSKAAAVDSKADPKSIEIVSWEVPRESLVSMFASGQRIGEGTGGRAYSWAQAAKILETLQTTGQPLGNGKSVPLAANSQLAQDTPPTAPEMFQFAIGVQVTKFENKEASVRWLVNYALPQPEPPGQTAPAMRQVLEGAISGNAVLTSQGLIMLVMEPLNRNPRDEYIAKAGFGPWSVFSSPEFRSGLTDWVMVIQLK